MLNTISLMGRVASAPELRSTQSGVSVTTWTLAVDRDFQSGGTNRECDFISCVAWKKTAEFVAKYWPDKGQMMGLVGRLQSRKWEDKTGAKRVSWEVIVESVYFCGKQDNSEKSGNPNVNAVEFEELDDSSGTLPF